jgi:hypothetical protein
VPKEFGVKRVSFRKLVAETPAAPWPAAQNLIKNGGGQLRGK